MSGYSKEIEAYFKVRKRLNFSKVNDLLGFTPHKGQEEIFNILQEGKFEVLLAVLGRRFGKTTAIGKIATGELICPFASVLIVAPSTSNAKVLFNQIYKDCLVAKLKVASKDTKQMTFELTNGARLQVITSKNYDGARGFHFSLVIYEEYTYIEHFEEIYDEVVTPAQADYGVDEFGYANSKTIMIGTATYTNTEAYKIFRKGLDGVYKTKGYISLTLPSSTNPLISPQYIEKKREGLPKDRFEREYEGIWTEANVGRVYHAFNQSQNVLPAEVIEQKIPYAGTWLVGLDLGFNDNTAYLLAFVENITGNIYIVSEYQQAQSATSHHIEEYKKRENQYIPLSYTNTIYRFGDPAGKQIWYDLSVDYGYFVNPAFNKIGEGVQQVNTAFEKGRLFISDACRELIMQVDDMEYKDPAAMTVKREKGKGHYDLALASLRYMVASWNFLGDSKISVV
jgi:hypothetical protein